jgi:23S rRNA pseudouridine1911/1915/1917 synthase
VDKSAGIAVEKISSHIISLEDLALGYLKETVKYPFVGIVHRLDRPTGGVLLLAKKPSVLKKMNAQFEERTIRKHYLALVEGEPPQLSGTLSHYLQKDTIQKKAIVSEIKNEVNREVKLKYRKIGNLGKKTLLAIELLTGKYHQIRAQLAFVGCPIEGDLLYGGNSWSEEGIGLHASEIQFNHPETEERLCIKSEWRLIPTLENKINSSGT